MITSVDNKQIKEASKLNLKKYRDAQSQYLVEGEHLIEEALQRDLIETIYTTEEHTKFEHAILVSPHVMKKLTEGKHTPRYIAQVKKHQPKEITSKVLVLENVQDPGNLGTLLRSALAFGFKSLILDECVDLYNPKVLRATQGAHFKLNIHQISVKEFKLNYPHKLIGTSLNGTCISKYQPKEPYAILLGNEGQGLKTESLSQCNQVVTIPIEQIDSLNVAIAGSILMYHFTQTKA